MKGDLFHNEVNHNAVFHFVNTFSWARDYLSGIEPQLWGEKEKYHYYYARIRSNRSAVSAEDKVYKLVVQLKGDPSKPGGLGKKFKQFARDLKSKAIEDGLNIIRAEIEATGKRTDTMDPTEVPVDYTAIDDEPEVKPWTRKDARRAAGEVDAED